MLWQIGATPFYGYTLTFSISQIDYLRNYQHATKARNIKSVVCKANVLCKLFRKVIGDH